MSSGAAQLRFAADFALFLVAGAGIALLFLRPALLVSVDRLRSVVAIGFGLLAASSFVHGAGFVGDLDAPGLIGARLLGIAAISLCTWRWPGAAMGRLAIWIGVLSLVAAEVALASDGDVEADWARLLGAAAVGVGVFLAARRSIPARIATSASAIVLVVVLGVSVGLSAVLADNVEDEAGQRLASEAGTEAAIAADAGRTALKSAEPAAEALGSATSEVLTRLANPNDPEIESLTASARAALEALVTRLIGVFDPAHGPVMLVSPDPEGPRRLTVVGPDEQLPSEAVLSQLQANDVVAEAIRGASPRQSIVSVGDAAYGLAAVPVEVPAGPSLMVASILVVTSPLDDGYVSGRQALAGGGDERGLAIVSRTARVASAGDVGSDVPLVDLAIRAIDGNGRATSTTGGLVLAAEPVHGADGAPVLAAVTAMTVSAVQATRSELFELLFLIAAGATALALLLAAVVGERIGTGLRTLTAAAGEVTSGNLNVSPHVRTDDELGVLSSAFASMTGSLRGMTADLRQAADEEERLRSRMEAVVAGMGDALIAVDEHGRISDFNAAAQLLTGVPAGEAIGRPAGEVVRLAGDDGDDLAARMGAPSRDGWSAAGTVAHTTGIEIPAVVSAGVLRGREQQVAGAVYVLRDVRREREVERLKSEFLANISHELRTPLSPIKGYSQILRSRDIPADEVRRFATEIEEASDRLERVVAQLVNFSSMSAGHFEVRPESVLVREMLDHVVGRWSDRLDPELFPISRRVERDLPKASLDRESVEQALDELVDNAVKYSPSGGRIELIATAQRADGNRMVRIAVSDAGVGIPDDRLDDVLGDFTQVDGSNTRGFGGLGLGLALVGRIARAHGGWIELDSIVGKGTTVTMALPADGAGGEA